MSMETDIAMSVVKYAVQGTVYTTKIVGKGVGTIASKITKALSSNKDTIGKTNIQNLIKRGKTLEVISMRSKYVKPFSKIAKKYGIKFCAIKDNKIRDGMTDLLIDQDEKKLINRIIERYGFLVDRPLDKGEIEIESQTKENPTPQTEQNKEIIEDKEIKNGVSNHFLQETENPLKDLLTNSEEFETTRTFSVRDALENFKLMLDKFRNKTRERSDIDIER